MGNPPPESTTGPPPFLRRIISIDATISHYLHKLTRPVTPRSLLLLLELSADFRLFFPIALSLFFATPSSSVIRSHLLSPLILCSLLDLFFVALVKFLVRRSRPLYANHDAYNAVVSVDNFSFPSGHSSRVFFIASLFYLSQTSIIDAVADQKAQAYPGFAMLIHRWTGGDVIMAVNLLVMIIWLWAIVTALSRVILGRHYVLDVFIGSTLGVLEALFTFRFLRFQVFS